MTRRASALALCWVLASCRNPAPMARGDDDGTIKRYRLKGVVARRDVAHKFVTIKHGPIKNDSGKVWMEAMTMEFPVLKEPDFQILQIGASISAVVASRASDFKYWIEEVRLVERSPKGVD
jgi:Cu/Ag efflux protein CusF